jgi:hypothetical protein
MSEQPTDVTPAKPAEAAKLDPAATGAAIAPEVTSAEPSSAATTDATQTAATADKPLSGLGKVRALSARADRKHAAFALTAALALALCWTVGSQALSGVRPLSQTPPGWAEAMTGIRQSQEAIGRLVGDVNALKGVVAELKGSFDHVKTDATAQNRPLLERLDTLERASRAASARMARGTEAAEGTEGAVTAPDAKSAAFASRPDVIDRPLAEPSRTGSVPDAKAAAKPKPVEGWVLREVYDGGALVESRNGRLYEVAPGRNLPSVGRVESIERRGRIWVVVTAKGIIGPPARWR